MFPNFFGTDSNTCCTPLCLHYSYSTPKSHTKDNNLDEQLIFMRITAIVDTVASRNSVSCNSGISRHSRHIVQT